MTNGSEFFDIFSHIQIFSPVLATGCLSSGIVKGRTWGIAHILCMLQVFDYVWSHVFHPQALCLLVRFLDCTTVLCFVLSLKQNPDVY